MPYLDAKTLRGKADKSYLTEGKVIDVGEKVILVDGENSGEVFDIPFRGYMGSTFKTLEKVSQLTFGYLNVVLDYYRDTFRGNKIGAAIPHLNKNLFKSLLIGIPPLAEQARIVAEIEKFEPLIAEYDKLEQQATKLDEEIYDKLKKSILQYAIQGKLVPQDPNDEPASVLLERIRAEKKAKLGKKYLDSYIYKGDDNCYYEHIAGRTQDELVEVPFDIPDNWVWSKLLDVLDVRDGTHDTPKYVDVGFPLVTSKNLNNGAIDFSTTKNISEQDLNNINLRSKVDEGDILFAMIGSIGNPVQVRNIERPFAIKNMALFKSQNTAINMEYVYYFLMISQDEMKKSASGAVQAFVSLNYLRNYYISIPPLAEQNRIVAKINEIFAML